MTTTTVNSTDALLAAVRSAHAGDTILLAAGVYNGVALYNLNFSTAVTIKSADANNQAIINNLDVGGSTGLAFSQLHFNTTTDTAAYVGNSHNISFLNDTFRGANTASGSAMMIRASDHVTVSGSDFGTFATGVTQLDTSYVTINNNTFHDIQTGDVRGTNATYSTISNNTFLDAKASVANHTDVIYLWQDNTANHVTISGNTYGGAATTPPASGSGSTSTGSGSAGATSGGAHTVNVSSTADLLKAVKQAHAGDTILLAAGTYNGVALSNVNFSSAVTIQSADATHQAVINNLTVSSSSGLAFNQVHLATASDTAAYINASHDLSFTGDTFQGTTSGVGNAMLIQGGANIAITGSDFGKFGTGINELTADNVSVTNNTFHDILAGAIRGTGVTNEVISGNTFADAKASVADHSDVIYLWQNNTANHVTITGNTYGSGGTDTQPVTTPPPVVTTPPPATTPPPTSPPPPTTTQPATGTHQTVTVSNVAELETALNNAHGGDTILLKAGAYDGAYVYSHNYDGMVTIASADSAHQAVINNLDVAGSSNVAFTNLNVQVTGTSNYAVSVANSSHVSLDGLTITGTSTGHDGVGVWVRSSNDVTVENSSITKLGSGIGHLDDSGLTISNNTLQDLGTDGIVGAGSSHVVISGNTINTFTVPDGAHPDAIQFFGGDFPATDIQILNNVITRGSGDVIQGIFIEGGSNITISGNALAGTMYNGIALSVVSDTLVSNNFVDGFTDMNTWIITRGASSDVTVVHNSAQSVVNYAVDGVNPNYVGSDNTTVAPTAVGDLSALKAWLSAHAGVTAALTGGEGSDTLTGTAGADTMSGGFGDDVYTVNNAGDVVNEAANAGVDTVHSSLATYTLGANVENLVLTGTTSQTGIGNSLDNRLWSNGVQASLNGGAGNDTLVATGGADTLTGGAGSDVFVVGNAAPTTPVVITDFTSGQDVLDLHAVLTNYHGNDPIADKWVQFQSTSSGLNVMVDVDGPNGSAGFVSVAKLTGVSALSTSDWVFH